MVEVTRKNFEELLPDIAESIQNSTFVALDAEYTGIYSDELKLANTLFDSASQRYSKLRSNVMRFVACQYGLAIFRKERDSNRYRVETYSFYLHPVSFDAFAKRDVISCQTSCMNFLSRHNFDFNKLFKEGVPYLNKEKSESLRSFLKSNRHFMRTTEYVDPDYFPTKLNYLCDEDVEEVINRLAGFSKILDIIAQAEKPLVGHNCLMDLLLTYHLFWETLPETYTGFKSAINKVFPLIYDTKLLAREVNKLRKSLRPDDHLLDDSNLFALYANTYSIFELNMPVVVTEGVTKKYENALLEGRRQNMETLPNSLCHNADFDALVTGCVFLNLAYMASRPQPVPDYRKGPPPTFSELLGKTDCWANRVNIARAIVPHLHLAGADPEPHRPNWIYAKSVTGHLIDPVNLKLNLAKYGDVEIDPLNEFEVIVACGSLGCHRHVWRHMQKCGYELTEKCLSSEVFLSEFQYRTQIGIALAIVGVAVLIKLII